jgi:hypothetical protein
MSRFFGVVLLLAGLWFGFRIWTEGWDAMIPIARGGAQSEAPRGEESAESTPSPG